ncbi:hypothetical protein Cpir12675_004069 [Ceratocystis pirilliformis]|uniref:Carbohydrate-binding module family 19 protein n=1 Tax=Ceratocystis pirilliformis TaxID=259994 RepID=A0ABR3Z0C4_9PEZI
MGSILSLVFLAWILAISVEAGPLHFRPRHNYNTTSTPGLDLNSLSTGLGAIPSLVTPTTVPPASTVVSPSEAVTSKISVKEYTEDFSNFFNSGTPSPIFSPIEQTTTGSWIVSKSKPGASSFPTEEAGFSTIKGPGYVEVTVLPDAPTTVTVTPPATSTHKTQSLTSSTEASVQPSLPVADVAPSATPKPVLTIIPTLSPSSSKLVSTTKSSRAGVSTSNAPPVVTSFPGNGSSLSPTQTTPSADVGSSAIIIPTPYADFQPSVSVPGSSFSSSSDTVNIIVTLTAPAGAVVTIPGLTSSTSSPSAIVPSIVYSAPPSTGTVSPETYSANLDLARGFNMMFSALTVSSRCTTESVACIDGDMATCDLYSRRYALAQCGAGTKCYAIPLNTTDGVQMDCYKQDYAEYILGTSSGSPSSTPSIPRPTTESVVEATEYVTVTVTPTLTSFITVPGATFEPSAPSVSGEEYETVTYTPTNTRYVTATVAEALAAR